MALALTAARPGLRRVAPLARHPAAPVVAVAAAAWAAFAGLAWGAPAVLLDPGAGGGEHHGAEGAGLGAAGATAAMDGAAASATIAASWALMVLAMMLPTTAPALRYVAQSARRDRRRAMVATFLGGYLAAWMLFTPAVVAAHRLAGAAAFPALLGVAALAGAAAWELTPWKRRALRRCHRTSPLRYAGAAAVTSNLRFGLRHGLACAAACGPAMLALAVSGHPLLATLAVAALLAGQKLRTRGEALRPWTAAALLLAAALTIG